ncbi:MAG: hypothetical protein ACM359_08715 [Bacillota bacterium]
MCERNNKPFWTSKPRRGSVLVIVVAVLTMIALIGTAYIATARLDRYNAQNSVANAEKESSRDAYIAQAEKLVKDVIARDIDNPVTGPRTCSWLADRLPQSLDPDTPYHIKSNPATWRFITGKLHPDLEDDRYFPPMWPPVNAPNNVNWAYEVATLLKAGNGTSGDGANRFIARPNWVTLSYPNNYPVEAYRNKVRTYPGFQFVSPDISHTYVPNNGNPYIYLAADADGDGIADSVLYRLSSGPVQGVTYYMGARIIDNSSAININTARTRGDASYNPTTGNPFDPTTQGLRTFFPSSIGLRELFMAEKDFGPRPNAGYELWAIDDYRFGFVDQWTKGSDTKWDQWIPSVEPIAERRMGPGPLDVEVYSRLTDYAYTTLGEALSMQLARRMEHPGLNRVSNYNPPAPSVRGTFRFQAFDDASTAALAYRFCMLRVDPETDDIRDSLTALEQRVFEAHQGGPFNARIDSLVRSAPNYTDDPHNTFKSFPADEVDWWFRHLNYDDKRGSIRMGAPVNVAVSDTSIAVPPRFRSVRPLLTGHNPVTNLIQVKSNGLNVPWAGLFFGQGYAWSDVLYPGMLCLSQPNQRFPRSRYRGDYSSGTKYYIGDIVSCPFGSGSAQYRLTYMYIGPDNSTPSVSPTKDSLWSSIAGYGWNPHCWDPQPYVCGLSKASINTAGFPELWRAYFMAMSDPDNGTLCPYEQAAAGNPTALKESRENNYRGMEFTDSTATPTSTSHPENLLRMFRSSIRDPQSPNAAGRFSLSAYQMMVLRSALAAVNTVSLRTSNDSTKNQYVPTRNFTMYDGKNRQFDVSVYGMRPQPFITEVYANNDTSDHSIMPGGEMTNPHGYIAIELYNPYSTAISLNNWKLAIIERKGPSLGKTTTLTHLATLGAITVQPGDYVVLENYGVSGKGAAYRPQSAKTPTNVHAVPDLSNSQTLTAFDHELVLLRPTDPNSTTEPLERMVPVDQFDFTGLTLSPMDNKTTYRNSWANVWHYVRANSTTNLWKFVYPGRYVGTKASRRHQGIDEVTYQPNKYDLNLDPNDPQANLRLNANKRQYDPWHSSVPTGKQPINLGSANSGSSYDRTCVIPWHTTLAIPPKPVGMTVNVYPFGGFARNADILQVPFIGAYTIRDLTGTKVVEMNAVTMDSAFAEDTLTDNNEPSGTLSTYPEIREQVGRFCPLMPITASLIANDMYDWTGRIFEYLDVEAPTEDFFPNADPATYPGTSPRPVASSDQLDSQMYEGRDETVPSHGKININTAPTKVLAMLPLVPDAAGLIHVDNTEKLARNIDTFRRNYCNPTWRAAKMPTADPQYCDAFRTILDLNRVPELREAASNLATFGSPANVGNYIADTLKTGYDDRFLITNRVSNLITTRSDTFTVYIVVQGWREADTNLPCLEWEQRKAFIIDRSAGPDKLKIIPVPTD